MKTKQLLLSICITISLAISPLFSKAQNAIDLKKVKAGQKIKETVVKSIFTDPNTSTFIIWVKDEVTPHVHLNHTEQVMVLSGRGTITYGAQTLKLKKGVWYTIPPRVIHSVRVKSVRPLKVLSIQAPEFDGTDREQR